MNEIMILAGKAAKYDALVNMLFDGAKFATKMGPCDPDDVYIDCFDVRLLLKAFEPERYAEVVALAKEKAAEKSRLKEKEAADGAAD